MSEEDLDARNLLCPLPVIRTQDRVVDMQAGDTLRVVSTDHGVVNDIPAWCRINGHEVLSIDEQDNEIIITIRVGNTD
jgi:tRNA 2-thiouridine synthesizing protein A